MHDFLQGPYIGKPRVPQHGRQWVSQALSWLFALNTSRNAPSDRRLEHPLPGKFDALLSRGGVPTRAQGRRQTPGDPYRAD